MFIYRVTVTKYELREALCTNESTTVSNKALIESCFVHGKPLPYVQVYASIRTYPDYPTGILEKSSPGEIVPKRFLWRCHPQIKFWRNRPQLQISYILLFKLSSRRYFPCLWYVHCAMVTLIQLLFDSFSIVCIANFTLIECISHL